MHSQCDRVAHQVKSSVSVWMVKVKDCWFNINQPKIGSKGWWFLMLNNDSIEILFIGGSWGPETLNHLWLLAEHINKKHQMRPVSLTHALLAISCLVLRKLGSQKLEACTLSLSYSVDVSLLRITEVNYWSLPTCILVKSCRISLTKPLINVRSCKVTADSFRVSLTGIFTSNRSNFWPPGRVAAIHNELREVFAPAPPREPGNNGAMQGNTHEISWGSMPPPKK